MMEDLLGISVGDRTVLTLSAGPEGKGVLWDL